MEIYLVDIDLHKLGEALVINLNKIPIFSAISYMVIILFEDFQMQFWILSILFTILGLTVLLFKMIKFNKKKMT